MSLSEKFINLHLDEKDHPNHLKVFNYDEEGNIVGYMGEKVYGWVECEKHGWYPTRYRWVKYGEKINCKCPRCLYEEIMAERFSSAGIPKRFLSHSIESFCAVEAWQQKVKQQAVDFVENLDSNLSQGRCIVMCGNPGTGKTHIAIGIALKAIRQWRTAVYTTVQDLVFDIRDTYGTGATSKTFKKFADVDLLIIDEVGVQSGTDNERQILFKVINDRYGAMKSTIIMSNLSKDGIVEYIGPRAWDRLCEYTGLLFVFSGKSHRRDAMPAVPEPVYKMKKMILPEEIEYLRECEESRRETKKWQIEHEKYYASEEVKQKMLEENKRMIDAIRYLP